MAGTIPFSAPLREHHLNALNLLNVYFLLLEGEMLPGYAPPELFQRIPVRMLLNRMETAANTTEFALTDEDAKLLYAAWAIGNKLMGSSRGEYIGGLVTQQLPAGHPLKEFSAFRKAFQETNDHLIADADRRWAGEIPDLAAWKHTLEQVRPEPGRS